MKIIDAKLQVVEVPLPHPFPSTWNPGNPETKLFVTIAEIITDDGIHGYGAACDSSQLLAGIWDTHIRPSTPASSTPPCTPTAPGAWR